MAGNAQRIAVAVGIAAAFLLSGSSPALADHPLEPDLQTTPLGDADLEVYKPTKSRTLLGITNEVGNAGAGPLEITPSPVTPECVDPSTPHDEYTASQTIYEDSEPLNGYFER